MQTSGTFSIVSYDSCTQHGTASLTGNLEITGKSTLVTINAKAGERHFVLGINGIAYSLTLKWLKLTGGDATNFEASGVVGEGMKGVVKAGGSILLFSGAELLVIRECWFHNNRAVMGGSIYQRPFS